MAIASRRRALMGQKRKAIVFHWDKSNGTQGLTFTGTAAAPSIDSTGLKIPYGPSWAVSRILIPSITLNKFTLEIQVVGFDTSTYNGDITLHLNCRGVYSRALYNSANNNWTLYDGSTFTPSSNHTIKANFTIRCDYDHGTATWYIDDTLIASHTVGINPTDNRVFTAESSESKIVHLTRIDIWRT